MTNTNTNKTFSVTSVVPAATAAGFIPVITRTRASKGEESSPGNRVRCVQIPEFDVSGLPSKWTMFAANALAKVASEQLAELWKQEPGITETHASLWTVDSLLAYAAREQENRRLSAETIAAALPSFLEVINPAARAKATAILISMAAPVKKGSEEQLHALWRKLDSFLNDQEDPGLLLPQLARKMSVRIDELRAQREEFETETAF